MPTRIFLVGSLLVWAGFCALVLGSDGIAGAGPAAAGLLASALLLPRRA